MTIRITARTRNRVARWLAAVTLLLLYGVGSTQTGYLHQLFHPDELAAIHSRVQEQDPCHRALFHGIGVGCRHEFHLVKVSSCGLFHTISHNDVQLSFAPPVMGTVAEAAPSNLSDQGHSRLILKAVFLRGPPFGSIA